MDVRLSPEQQALRDAAAQLVDRLGPATVADLDDSGRVGKLDDAIESSGWRELRMANDDGSPLASGVEVAIIAEELGRGLADAPFMGPILASELRRRAGAPPVDESESVLLTSTLAGPVVLADGAPEPGAVAIDAHRDGQALLLDPASGDHTVAAVAVRRVAEVTDLTRPTAVVEPATQVQSLDEQSRSLTDDDLASWTSLGLTITCADLVGTMRGAIRLSCEYASQRKQYGTEIGSFQAVQHLLADAFVMMEGAHSASLHAAWAVDALPAHEAVAAAAVAKAYCARAARTVCETAIQVHGGIGNTWECLAHVFLRRALMSTDILGGVGPSLTRVLDHHGIDQRAIGGSNGLR